MFLLRVGLLITSRLAKPISLMVDYDIITLFFEVGGIFKFSTHPPSTPQCHPCVLSLLFLPFGREASFFRTTPLRLLKKGQKRHKATGKSRTNHGNDSSTTFILHILHVLQTISHLFPPLKCLFHLHHPLQPPTLAPASLASSVPALVDLAPAPCSQNQPMCKCKCTIYLSIYLYICFLYLYAICRRTSFPNLY